MSSTRPSLLRLFKIHQAISQKDYPSAERLAEECAVNARTIKRDVKVLRDDFDAPVIYSRRHQGYHYTRDFNLTALPLTEGELLALCMMRVMADTFRNTHFAPAITRALRKLQVLLPETVQSSFADECPHLSYLYDAAPPERAETCIFFNDLLRATEEHRQVRLKYYSMRSDAETTRVVDPCHLFHRRGMWYLYAWCHLRKEMRDFALERIRQLDVLDATFISPDAADIRARLAQRFSLIEDVCVDVAIRFDPDAARRIRERIWHPSQCIDDHPDGSCTLFLTVEGLRSVTRWVLGFGCHAHPLAPPELVEQVRAEAQAIVAMLTDETATSSLATGPPLASHADA